MQVYYIAKLEHTLNGIFTFKNKNSESAGRTYPNLYKKIFIFGRAKKVTRMVNAKNNLTLAID